VPGGLLSHGIYLKLGGEREFGEFWRQLGLPTIAVIALCWLLVGKVITQKSWLYASIAFIASIATAVYARAVR